MAVYPVKVQVALFLSTIDLTSRFRIAGIVRDRSNGQLSADPVLLPIATGIPPEFPQILIRDEQTHWTFQLAPARLDLVLDYGRHNAQQPLSETARLVSSMAIRIWEGCQQEFGARGNRIGIIITAVEEHPNATELFRQRYLNEGHGGNSIENHFYTLTKPVADGFSMNHWVKVIATLVGEGVPPRIITEVDINTVSEIPVDVDAGVIRAFTDTAINLANSAYTSYA